MGRTATNAAPRHRSFRDPTNLLRLGKPKDRLRAAHFRVRQHARSAQDYRTEQLVLLFESLVYPGTLYDLQRYLAFAAGPAAGMES